MKLNQIHINALLVAVIVVLLLFPRSPKAIPDKTGEIKALEKVNESLARERDIYREWKDEKVSELQRRDSALTIQVKNNVRQYEKVTPTVRNYSNEELRRAVEAY